MKKQTKDFKEWCIKNNIETDLNITYLTKIKYGGRDRLRELVRIRDKHTCTKCKIKWVEGDRRFDVHQKIKTKDCLTLNDTDDMFTICHFCNFNLKENLDAMKNAIRKDKKVKNLST